MRKTIAVYPDQVIGLGQSARVQHVLGTGLTFTMQGGSFRRGSSTSESACLN